MTDLIKNLIAEPGKKHHVHDFSTNDTYGFEKESPTQLLQENIELLAELQDKFYALDKYALLIVFQAMDAARKDGTIKHVMSGINPQGCQVYSFKQPSNEELDHGYMWRIMKALPERGRFGIFNRSHYEEVLVTKVHPEIILNQQLPEINQLDDIGHTFWEKRYQQINDIERYMHENGTIILKFFLNVSQEEQKKRFLSRLDDKSKNWKFSLSDLKEREYWDDYMQAYSDVFTHTSTSHAPWHIIPADHKWFMRYAVSKIITEKLESLNLHYPEVSEENQARLKAAKDSLMNSK